MPGEQHVLKNSCMPIGYSDINACFSGEACQAAHVRGYAAPARRPRLHHRTAGGRHAPLLRPVHLRQVLQEAHGPLADGVSQVSLTGGGGGDYAHKERAGGGACIMEKVPFPYTQLSVSFLLAPLRPKRCRPFSETFPTFFVAISSLRNESALVIRSLLITSA